MFTQEELNAAFAHMRARRWHSSYDARLHDNDKRLQVYAEYHGWYDLGKERSKVVLYGDYPGAERYYDSLEEAMDAIYRKCEAYRKRRFFENALEGLPKQVLPYEVDYGGCCWVRLRRAQSQVVYFLSQDEVGGFEFRVVRFEMATDTMWGLKPCCFEDAVAYLMEILTSQWATLPL